MPRANRYFLPGHIWHITHRCHKKEFLLKFVKDRKRLRYWLFQARKRYGLCVLNYIVIAGRTAQEYNLRKSRKGAFWEDRYHATAVDSETYLSHCLAYIDLNMVRAGVVNHPGKWDVCGYREIQNPPKRYAIIDRQKLAELLGFQNELKLRGSHAEWIEDMLSSEGLRLKRESKWTESLAVGHRSFVEDIKTQLGVKGRYRDIEKDNSAHIVNEPAISYTTHLKWK